LLCALNLLLELLDVAGFCIAFTVETLHLLLSLGAAGKLLHHRVSIANRKLLLCALCVLIFVFVFLKLVIKSEYFSSKRLDLFDELNVGLHNVDVFFLVDFSLLFETLFDRGD
jgi:hypothetical protein